MCSELISASFLSSDFAGVINLTKILHSRATEDLQFLLKVYKFWKCIQLNLQRVNFEFHTLIQIDDPILFLGFSARNAAKKIWEKF